MNKVIFDEQMLGKLGKKVLDLFGKLQTGQLDPKEVELGLEWLIKKKPLRDPTPIKRTTVEPEYTMDYHELANHFDTLCVSATLLASNSGRSLSSLAKATVALREFVEGQS